MKRHSINARQGIALLAVLFTGGLLAPGAFAQGQDGPPPPGGNDGPPPPMDGQGGPPMRRGMGGGPGMGGPGRGPISASTVPVSVLATGLNLTADQKTKITQIQQDVQKERRSLMAPPPGSDNDGPPDPETMRANRQKMRNLDDRVKTQIEGILTADQKQSLPGLMKTLQALQAAGIPPVLYGDLKLTADQKTKIAALAPAPPAGGRGGPQDGGGGPGPGPGFGGPGQGGPGRGMGGPGGPNPQAREQVMAVLTDDQKSTVKDFQKTHPMMQRPGGPGRRGQGGPDGGPGGPPPGGQGDGPPPPPPGDQS